MVPSRGWRGGIAAVALAVFLFMVACNRPAGPVAGPAPEPNRDGGEPQAEDKPPVIEAVKPVVLDEGNSKVHAVALSRDNVAAWSRRGTFTIYDLKSSEKASVKATLDPLGSITALAFSSDGKSLASGGSDKVVAIWDVGTAERQAAFPTDNLFVNGVAFSPDGKLLAATAGGIVRLWDVVGRKQIRQLDSGAILLHAIAFRPDGKALAVAGSNGAVTIWDVATWQSRTGIGEAHEGQATALAFSQDGKAMATGGADQFVKLWDVASKRQKRALAGHTDHVQCLAFFPNGRLLVSGGTDDAARIWDVREGKELAVLAHETRVGAVCVTPDGESVLTGSDDGKVRLWSLRRGKGERK